MSTGVMPVIEQLVGDRAAVGAFEHAVDQLAARVAPAVGEVRHYSSERDCDLHHLGQGGAAGVRRSASARSLEGAALHLRRAPRRGSVRIVAWFAARTRSGVISSIS